MKIKGSIAKGVILAMAFTFIPLTAVSAQKINPGLTCKVLNQKVVYQNKSYTCNKSGKKLVWGQGNKVTPIPSPSSKLTSGPTDFSDLYEKRRGILTALWTKINAKLSSRVQLPSIEVYRGPNTPVHVKDPSEYFKFVAQVFSDKPLPKKIVVFYWTRTDMEAVATKALAIMGAENDRKHRLETTGPFVDCYSPTSCDVGHAFIGNDGIAYLGLGIPDTFKEAKKTAGGIGGIEVVEFYHSLNLLPYYLNSVSVIAPKQNTKSPLQPPFWFKQGSENVMSMSLAHKNDLKTFTQMSGRKSWVNQTIPDFGPDWINNYLDISNLGNEWSDSSFKNSKPHLIMGMYLIEIFGALKGPSVMLDFFDQMSQKKSFTDVFQDTFGTTWNDAKPEIARVIYDRYLNNY
jgi:hypothetical protein